MVLSVVKYGDPVLRRKGERIQQITGDITTLIAHMFETMQAARGVGLAAQQVGHALQLAVIDVRAVTDRPSTLQLNGREAPPESIMPLTLINPEVTPTGPPLAGPEGCLSFPEIYADISRPQTIHVAVLNGKGERFEFDCGGLLARAVQHEVDHLNGILFIDRMAREDKESLQAELETLRMQTKAGLKKETKR